MRHLSLAALLAAAAMPLAAQQRPQVPVTKEPQPVAAPAANRAADPDRDAAGGVQVPGWTARFDKAAATPSQVRFVRMGDGLHVTAGPAAIYYDPANVAGGDFALRARFTQTRAPMHPEAYGLMLAGARLDAADQSYLYFLVRQDGKYTIRHRAGADVHPIVEWTEHAAVVRADSAGKATNALEVRAEPTTIRFLVNGTEVQAFERGKPMTVEGIVGLRVNHNLDVHVDGFALAK